MNFKLKLIIIKIFINILLTTVIPNKLCNLTTWNINIVGFYLTRIIFLGQTLWKRSSKEYFIFITWIDYLNLSYIGYIVILFIFRIKIKRKQCKTSLKHVDHDSFLLRHNMTCNLYCFSYLSNLYLTLM